MSGGYYAHIPSALLSLVLSLLFELVSHLLYIFFIIILKKELKQKSMFHFTEDSSPRSIRLGACTCFLTVGHFVIVPQHAFFAQRKNLHGAALNKTNGYVNHSSTSLLIC